MSFLEAAVRFVFFDIIAMLMVFAALMGLVFGLILINMGGVS